MKKLKSTDEILDESFWTDEWDGTGDEIANLLTQDRNQAYEELIKGIEGMKTDERKVATFGEWQAESYEDKMLVNAILADILENVVKPLYNKTGDN